MLTSVYRLLVFLTIIYYNDRAFKMITVVIKNRSVELCRIAVRNRLVYFLEAMRLNIRALSAMCHIVLLSILLGKLANGKFHCHLREIFAPQVIRYVDLMESSIGQSIHRGS